VYRAGDITPSQADELIDVLSVLINPLTTPRCKIIHRIIREICHRDRPRARTDANAALFPIRLDSMIDFSIMQSHGECISQVHSSVTSVKRGSSLLCFLFITNKFKSLVKAILPGKMAVARENMSGGTRLRGNRGAVCSAQARRARKIRAVRIKTGLTSSCAKVVKHFIRTRGARKQRATSEQRNENFTFPDASYSSLLPPPC